jgi:uncharacterized protein YbjT (DUF2867 family)
MYVLLGSNGQITSQLARRLVAAGHPTCVVGRTAAALAPLRQAGVRTAVGDPADPVFLESAFAGATAVYAMTPPCYAEPDMRSAQARIGSAVAQALRRARVRRVVNLSSIGAELPAGTGPIVALHEQERRLDAIDGIDLLHLRSGYFMENLLAATGAVAAGGVLPGMEAPDVPIPMAATRDLAAVAARELVEPQHRGVLVLHGPTHPTLRDVAAALGAAIGQPGLQYVQAAPTDARAAMLAQGLSADAAAQLEELARWLSSATAMASVASGPAVVLPTSLEDFVREVFAPAVLRAAQGRTAV